MNEIDYSKFSDSYNELHGEEQLKKLRAVMKSVQFNPAKKLLDVGCGSGIGTSLIKCRKAGIDPCIELLTLADKPLIKVLGCAENLPFKDKQFDFVISMTAIHNFTDIKKALLEMKRVAKDVVIISVLKRSRRFREIEGLIMDIFFLTCTLDDDKDMIYLLSSSK